MCGGGFEGDNSTLVFARFVASEKTGRQISLTKKPELMIK
jgi:hypothetical protein